MDTFDPQASAVMALSCELFDARETISHQRKIIWALTSVLRAQQAGSAALVDLADFLLAEETR